MLWSGTLYFDPNSDSRTEHGHSIEHLELIATMKRLIDGTQKIKVVSMYTVPLSSGQQTQAPLYHAFVVLETDGWYWSIEKNCQGITIQRSRKEMYVKDYHRRIKRTTTPQRISCSGGKINMEEYLDWMYRKKEVDRGYHVFSENCQHFAMRVYEKISGCEINLP